MALASTEHHDQGGVYDPDGRMVVVAGGSQVPSDQATTLTDGRKTVAAAGTALAIRASLACKWVTVTAFTTNTKIVAVGGAAVLATAGSEAGVLLQPGGAVTVPVSNANLVFVDALVNGEGVSFTVGS